MITFVRKTQRVDLIMTSYIFQEVPAEDLRQHIQIITGDNSVLLSTGNRQLFSSSVASCRYASGLTFKPIAVCFLRPQRNVIRILDRNEYFTLSYFSDRYKHLLNSFGTGAGAEKIEPLMTQLGSIYYSQAEWVFECRKVFNLELILSGEIQNILASEKKRSIYPGNETPRMFVGEIINGWHKTPASVAKDTSRQLTEAGKTKFLTSGER